ncbi:MAG TPA: transcription-repair coupling factor, partial [Microlunatus sp.]|nr:transcription-repair coupling factor [Microlunatus sp.]
MTLTGLVELFATDAVVTEAVGDARSRTLPALDLTSPPAMRSLIAAALAATPEQGGAGRPVLLVASTYREAESLAAACRSLLGEEEVVYYPAWETLPHERLSPRSDTVGRRLAVLRRVVGNDELPPPKIIVAPVRSVLQPQVKGLGHMAPVRLVVGEDIELDDLSRALVGAAYVRVDMVERRGEFAVRGGIVDIFPPTEEHPVRIDFFGDTIEEIRYFTVADQRSSELTLTEVIASPCRELLLTDEVRQRAFALSQQHPELIDMLDRIAQGHAVDGMEALSPVLVDGMELLVDVL